MSSFHPGSLYPLFFIFLYVHLQPRHMIGWCCTEKPACLHLLLWCAFYISFLRSPFKALFFCLRRSQSVSKCLFLQSAPATFNPSPPTSSYPTRPHHAPSDPTKAAVFTDSLPRPTCCCPVSVVTSTINCTPPCSRWLVSFFFPFSLVDSSPWIYIFLPVQLLFVYGPIYKVLIVLSLFFLTQPVKAVFNLKVA